MITLKTLPEATAQEVFDQVYNHLLTQNFQSISSDGAHCFYRSPEGFKCAAGCLIADDEYKEYFEGDGWNYLIEKKHVPVDHFELIGCLQYLHDKYHPAKWKKQLNVVAKQFDLQVPE